MRVLELRSKLNLSTESVHADRRRKLRRQNLNDDLSAKRRLPRHEYPRHSSTAKLALESVGSAKSGLKLVADVGSRHGEWVILMHGDHSCTRQTNVRRVVASFRFSES